MLGLSSIPSWLSTLFLDVVQEQRLGAVVEICDGCGYGCDVICVLKPMSGIQANLRDQDAQKANHRAVADHLAVQANLQTVASRSVGHHHCKDPPHHIACKLSCGPLTSEPSLGKRGRPAGMCGRCCNLWAS